MTNTTSSPEKQQWLAPSEALTLFNPAKNLQPSLTNNIQEIRYGFQINNLHLLISPSTVSEVIENTIIYPFPNTSPWFLGFVNVRGNLVPTYSLKSLLDLEESKPQKASPILLILDQGEKAVAIQIDGLPQALKIHCKMTQVPPLPPILKDYVFASYLENNVIWLEFDHKSFFQSLGEKISQ